MDKETLNIKAGESVELTIQGKTIEIIAEKETPVEPTEHIKSALGGFLSSIEKGLPELKGEKGIQ